MSVMKQPDLLRELEQLRAEFERKKKEKLEARYEKYRDFYVNFNILLRGFLEELGELLVALFEGKPTSTTEEDVQRVNEELVDLSNQLDFLYVYVNKRGR